MSDAFERALWVVRDRVVTPGACDDLLADAVTRGVRQLVVQVRGRADAYYTPGLEPRAEALADGAFDPLGHLVRNGAVVGARIHAWLNTHLVWSGGDTPRDPRHLVRAHPEWLLARDAVRYLDPTGRSDVAGHWIDPSDRQALLHTLAVAADIAERYAVEGLHWDHVRYPHARYASSPEDHSHVTAFVREAASRSRRIRADLVLSAAVFPDPDGAREDVLQRWPEWATDGALDLVCPMAYRDDTREVARLLAAARAAAPRARMWAGLMAPPDAPHRVREQVRAARDAGCDGAILFAYDPANTHVLDTFADS